MAQQRNTNTVPPDGKWGWVIAVSSGIIYFIVFGIVNSSGIFFIALGEQFEDRNTVAWISPVALAISRFIGPVAAALANRFSYRIVVLFGSLFMTTAFISTVFVQHMLLMFLTYSVFIGVGVGCIVFPAVTLTSLYFRKHLMFATGICSSGSAIGSIAMPLIMHERLESVGYHGTLIFLAALCLQICIFAALYQPVEWHSTMASLPEVKESSMYDETVFKTEESKHTFILPIDETLMERNVNGKLNGHIKNTVSMNKDSKYSKISNSVPTTVDNVSKFKKNFSFLTDPKYILLTITFCCSFFCYACLPAILPSFAVDVGDIDKQKATWLLSVMAISDLVSRLGLSWVWDYFTWLNRQIGYPIGVGLVGLVVGFLPLAKSYTDLVACVVVIGFLSGIVGLLVNSLYLEVIGPEKFGFAFSLSGVLTGIPLLVSGFLIGSMKETTGSYHASLHIVSGLQLGAFSLWVIYYIVQKFKSASAVN